MTERTHIIKRPRRLPEGHMHDPEPGGYGSPKLCAAIRTDGQVCGLYIRERLHKEIPTHWCQPPTTSVSDPSRMPCLYCGVPLVRINGEWYYADGKQSRKTGDLQMGLDL